MLRRPMPAVRRRLFRWVSLSPEPAHTRKERRAIEHNAEAAAAVLKKPSRHNVRVGRLTLTFLTRRPAADQRAASKKRPRCRMHQDRVNLNRGISRIPGQVGYASHTGYPKNVR